MPTKDEIKEFSTKIQEMANTNNIHCMEAILMHCEETGVEVEIAATLISPHLKSRIREEAQSVNLLKKTSKLPL
jgi:hypothetical protein